MNKIVIVEDKLKRGISLAEQFEEFSNEYPELELETADICFFQPDLEAADKIIRNVGDCPFLIKPVSLLNFNKIMDEYLYNLDSRTFLIIDFILDDDGSRGVPIRRINIRYARNNNRVDTNQLWFYTGTGILNEQILGELVGEEHVFDILKVDEEHLRLNLNKDSFIAALTDSENCEV